MPREIRKRNPESREDELFKIDKETLSRQDWQGDGNENFYDEDEDEDRDHEDEDYEDDRDEEDEDEEEITVGEVTFFWRQNSA